jgi:hypothetical protein
MMFEHIQPLTQQQRLEARQKAIKVIEALAGEKPKREHFKNSTISKYPHWITGIVVVLSLVVLFTAFLLSAMRLYHIGYQTFYKSVQDNLSSTVAGFAIVLLSEAAAVLFTIALSLIGQSKAQSRILALSIAGTAALALSGNYYVALDGNDLTVFSVLEAMLPPLLTLSTAYVLKELLLNIIEQRHTDQNAYEFVLMEWERSTVNPEQHPQFVQAYANELRDALIKSNRRRKVAREMMEQLASVEWKTLVKRELQTEEWFTATDYDHEEESVITETPLS